jgi:hypothetical protein
MHNVPLVQNINTLLRRSRHPIPAYILSYADVLQSFELSVLCFRLYESPHHIPTATVASCFDHDGRQ